MTGPRPVRGDAGMIARATKAGFCYATRRPLG
jgi:hypothetical protein